MAQDHNLTTWDAITAWLFAAGNQPPLILSAAEDETLMEQSSRIAQTAYCEQKSKGLCNTCKSCILVKNNSHPDVINFSTEGATIRIKDVRNLLSRLANASWSTHRIVIIGDSHKMNTATANTLLKSLEESSKATRWILTTRWPQRLLPTIRSRCVSVRITGKKQAPTTTTPLPTSILGWLTSFNGKEPLPADVLNAISENLVARLRENGPSKNLTRSLLRLRDYYVITAARGNERLARDVLLAAVAKEIKGAGKQ